MIRTRSTEDHGLALAAIQIDGGTQSRATLNQHVVDDYADAIQAGATFPPIVVFYDGKKHWLADGFHRFHAYQKAGREKVAADVRQGTRRDAILHSVGANETHGLRRTNDDKRRAVLTLLNDSVWGKWTDREIARACHVDNKTVAKVRSEVTEEIPSERTYVTKHGTTATMKTAGINASRTPFQAKASEDNGSITGEAGTVTGEAGRLASGRTDAGEEASVDLSTNLEAEPKEITPRNIFDALVALWKEADAGVRQDFKAYIRGSEAVEKLNSKSSDGERPVAAAGSENHSAGHVSPPVSQAVSGGGSANMEHDHVDCSASRADHAGQQLALAGQVEPQTKAKASIDGNASLAAREGEKSLHSNSNSSEPSSSQALTDSPVLTSSPASGTPFNNPRCQKPETCHLAHSRNECFECNLAWAKRPREEQVRLWAEAVQSARAA